MMEKVSIKLTWSEQALLDDIELKALGTLPRV
jgi:hypothetical protein